MNFKIQMDSNLQSTSKADADALDKVEKALAAESKALGIMEAQMKAIQKASVVDIAVFKQLDSAIKAQRDKVAGLTSQMVGYGRKGVDEVAKKQVDLAQAFGSFQQRAGPVGKFLSALGPWGVAAAIGIGMVVVAATAAVGALGGLIALGTKFSEQRGDAERMLETVFRSEEAAAHTYDVIVAVTKRVAISQEKAIEVADAMAKAGVISGDAMVRAVESVGKAEAARKGAGQAIQGIMERAERARSTGWAQAGFSVSRDELRAAGLTYADLAKTLAKQTGRGVQEAATALMTGRVSVAAGLDALNATIDEKLGPLAEKKFYKVGAAMQRMRDRFAGMFAKMDTGPLARAMDALGRMLDDSTVSGHALQTVLGGVFQKVSEWIEAAMPFVQTFVDGLILAGLKIYNGLYPLRKRLNDIFGGGKADVKSFEDKMLAFADTAGKVATFVADNAVPLMVAALWLLAPAIWAAVSAAGSLAVSVLTATWPFIAIGAAVYAFAKLMIWAWETASNIDWGYIVDQIADYFSMDNLAQIGADIIKGLIAGLNPIAFVASMTGLAEKGLDAFKKAFGIASPSTVMMQQGRYLNAGLAEGVEESADEPKQAMATSMRGPSVTAQSITNNNSQSNSRGHSITFAEGSIVINGISNAQELKQELPSLMADVFEQLGITLGAEAVA